MVIPLGCLYTPLKESPSVIRLNGRPPSCNSCEALINPFCQTTHHSSTWTCSFCHSRNVFPAGYASDPAAPPPELLPTTLTIDFPLSVPKASPPFYLLVVDTHTTAEELEALRSTLIAAVGTLPPDARVGLITFGTHCFVWEIGAGALPRAVFIGGDKAPSRDELADLLSLAVRGRNVYERFFVAAADADAALLPLLDEIAPDPWPTPHGQRPQRAAGVAVAVAAQLCCLNKVPANGRIVVCLSGPCTKGDGAVVGTELAQPIRQFKEIRSGTAPLFEKARAFYDGVADTLTGATKSKEKDAAAAAVANMPAGCVAVDLYTAALDQTGVAEFQPLVERSGGSLLVSESFKWPMSRGALLAMLGSTDACYEEPGVNHLGEQTFNPDHVRGVPAIPDGVARPALHMSYNVTMEVVTSGDLTVSGMVGPMASIHKMTASVTRPQKASSLIVRGAGALSDLQAVFGAAETSAWRAGSLSDRDTVALYFDVSREAPAEGRVPPRLVQIITSYTDATGSARVRVSTASNEVLIAPSASHYIAPLPPPQQGFRFDQAAATVLLSRLACRMFEDTHGTPQTLRWLDKILIRALKRYGEYRTGDPTSLKLVDAVSLLPGFFFHLRRSELIQVFNASPDETAYFRHHFTRAPHEDAILMLQPSLLEWAVSGAQRPVPLDTASVKNDNVVVLDAFFTVAVHYGTSVADWRNRGFMDDPQYPHIRPLVTTPLIVGRQLASARFPPARLIVCDQNGSAARFVKFRLNPSLTHKGSMDGVRTVLVCECVHICLCRRALFIRTCVRAHLCVRACVCLGPPREHPHPYPPPPQYGSAAGEIVYTEDASLQQFFDHLRKVVVDPKSI